MHRRGAQCLVDVQLNSSAQRSLRHTRHHSYAVSARRPPLSADDERRLRKDTTTIVDAAAHGDRSGWTRTKTLHGEERRFRGYLQSSRAPSLEKTNFFAGTAAELSDMELSSPEPIPPGTFVEIRRNEQSNHGVVLGQHYVDRQWQTITLSSQGEVWDHIKNDVMFTIPFLATREMALRCGTGEITNKKTEILARVEVLRRIRDLEKSVEEAYNVIGRSSKSLYTHVKASNPDEWSEVTVSEATTILSPHGQSSPITIFAVHKHLMALNNHYVADPQNYSTSQSFAVFPQSHVNHIEAITRMRQSGGAALRSFGLKAKEIISANRRRAAESWGEPPSQGQSDLAVFSPDDLVIINFLLNASRPRRTIQADPYALGVSSIVKHMDHTISHVNDGVLHQILMDLGVIPPWADLVSRKRELHLDQCSEETSRRVKEEKALVQKALSSRATSPSSRPLGPEDFYPSDMMESIRHDFGDMPVYVLDDSNAEELDDGISIEHIPSELNSTWVHIHIADPTSILHPDHVFSQQARNQLETRYFIHRTWPMLPRSLIRECLSLGTDSASGGTERVLTFSVKIDQEGNMLDYSVRAGIVRNLCIIPYDKADLAVMGQIYNRRFYPFGGESPLPTHSVHLDQVHLDNLRALNKLSERLIARRLKSPIFNLNLASVDLAMSPRTSSQDYLPSAKPTWFRGFPDLTYAVSDMTHDVVGFRRTVAEMMRLACWAGSRFCSDRGIPAVRRSAPPFLIPASTKLSDLLALRNAEGCIEFSDAMRYEIITPPAEYTLQPKGHWPIGIPDGEGYLRVTSPLRRYTDMVAHWQIKHALLNKKLPFSVERMEEFVKLLTARATVQRREETRHKTFWALQFIKRWMEDPRRKDGDVNPLQSLVAHPFNIPVMNFKTKEFSCGVRIPALGIDAFLGIRKKDEARMGEAVNVKVADIILGHEAQMMLAKR